ncbi:hypothetical protein BJX63DRAFT_276173 [Aspergillus granulosus]|uniref:Phospholipid scramblase n=1 Tax=Aspergillus granulosus TaxID=176169 RepID=A0ABR4H7G4_9EURO
MDSKLGENFYYDNQPHAWGGQHPQYPPQQPQYQQYPPTHPQAYPAYPPQQQMHPQFQNSYPQPPQQSLPAQSYPRTLDVAFTSWTGRQLRICENDETGPLVYAADLKSRKPHMLFQASGTAQLPASVIFHSFSRTIDISINNHEIPMRPTSKWKYEYGFDSPALGGKNLVWKKSNRWKYLNIECVDDTGTVYAQFNMHKGLSMKKAGKLDILEPCSISKGLVDELVVTGLAVVYLQLMHTMSANSAAGASAGVSAAVST